MRNPRALQIFLNTDDIEIVNPIGSHTKKHKITMFYYTLGNVPPHFRSRLQAIQLLGVARAKDLKKCGPGVLLEDFISKSARYVIWRHCSDTAWQEYQC